MVSNIKNFLNEEQDPEAVEKVTGKLSGILMSDETIEYVAVQKKPAVNINPDCIALTNHRIIFCRPKNLGFSMDFQEYFWKDIIDCKLKESFLGAEFSVNSHKGQNTLDYLPKAQARRLYAMSQEMEMKKSSFSTAAPVVETPAPVAEEKEAIFEEIEESISNNNISSDEITASLLKLKALFESQLITKYEYESKKADLLSKL